MVQRNRSIPLKPRQSRAALTITHPNAAGIDIGSASHFCAVPPDRADQPVREFASFTVDLHALADWLTACGVDTVAMESTGVYWIALFELLESRGFTFALQSPHERRELVAVCRSLLELGVLQRVAGDEEGFVRGDGSDLGAMHDALYDVHRRVLASLLAAVRGPSTWPADEAPVALAERLQSLVAEHVPDSDEGRRTTLRHHLSRRLLDDPVVYSDRLPDELLAYFTNQRGPMANRLCEATGLVPEQRAEGLALVDDSGLLSDVAMPAEGTDAHVTLLVAEYLASQTGTIGATDDSEVAAFVASVRERYGRFWRKSARESGSENELAATALERLHKLQLISHVEGTAQALPALARFAIGEADIRRPAPAAATPSLFD